MSLILTFTGSTSKQRLWDSATIPRAGNLANNCGPPSETLGFPRQTGSDAISRTRNYNPFDKPISWDSGAPP